MYETMIANPSTALVGSLAPTFLGARRGRRGRRIWHTVVPYVSCVEVLYAATQVNNIARMLPAEPLLHAFQQILASNRVE